MQRLCDGVIQGYTHWVAGSVDIGRCQKLVKKFDLTYQVLADRNLRVNRKRAEIGNARLYLWHTNGTIRWWLLVTAPEKGEHAAHSIEKLKNALEKSGRIEIDGFELVRFPKKKGGTTKQKSSETGAKQNNSTVKPKQKNASSETKWTWRMNESKYQNWRDSIIDTVRKGSSNNMHQMLYQLWSSPGFAGIRSQVGKLAALYRAEVQRSSRKDAPMPPKRLPYVRRLRDDGVSVAQLLKKATCSESQQS